MLSFQDEEGMIKLSLGVCNLPTKLYGFIVQKNGFFTSSAKRTSHQTHINHSNNSSSYLQTSSPHRAVKTLRLSYTNQSVNAV